MDKDKVVSPRFGGGSGLKQFLGRVETREQIVSPRFGGGSGLKPKEQRESDDGALVSPRFGGGSGLKLQWRLTLLQRDRSPLASAGGVD